MQIQSAPATRAEDLEPVVYRVTQILLASQIALRGLDRNMAEQELNLFQLAAAGVAQLGTGSSQVMRGHVTLALCCGSIDSPRARQRSR